MREFPNKLSASGWDIGKKRPELTTGFSGTNDSRSLLPFDVEQLDLAEQNHTNAKVLDQLLRPGNAVELIPRATYGSSDAMQLLHSVLCQKLPIQVILDVGAQIIELTNEQLALTWLMQHDKSKSGAIFVNDDDELCIIDRHRNVELLQTSSYSSRLDECLVFLDEAHTRGIDLKLPGHYRAAVTLGARVTKDRLMQACNRMRKLDDGQSIVFCVSDEIRDKIHAVRQGADSVDHPAPITIEDILAWSITETHTEISRSIPLWAVQGERFVRQQRIAESAARNGKRQLNKTKATRYLEKEARSIEERYQPAAGRELPSYLRPGEDTDVARITERCKQFEGLQYVTSTLQEEQERELSPENEAEGQPQRAAAATAHVQKLHPDIIGFAEIGRISQSSTAAVPAFGSLRGILPARAFNAGALDCSSRQLLLSKDFADTVKITGRLGNGVRSNIFHRSVQWFMTSCQEDSTTVDLILIISPYEANLLYPKMRAGSSAALHVYKACVNLAYDMLDDFTLYTIPGSLRKSTVPRSLAVRLNLFAGQLYIRSYEDYQEICAFLGLCSVALTQEMCQEGWRLETDGFIASDGDGIAGGRCGPKRSPVES
ncbi:hypothetical protein B0A48_08904 [Cryoendolithus antarcticus]|uniref:ubiquitinyl hydrolase 1 n=1 Tax=Cryoendolithus antarcticus TaxID=1507870 RepID=A0A1V8T4G9_9PEZI|nr:hypothetical protein B0A48_08904 [Cryoendolithus antarcticus]